MQSELLEKIKAELQKFEKKVLLFDYDGTLTSIVDQPAKAFLAPAVNSLLTSLNECPDVSLGVVTGRGLKDIKKLIDLDIIYITNHGYLTEINQKTEMFNGYFNQGHHYGIKYKMILNRLMKEFSDVRLETKEVSTAIHYRNVKKEDQELCRQRIFSLLKEYFAPRECRIKEGKKVIEILPYQSMDKGLAIKNLLTRLKTEQQVDDLFVIFIGDDLTDEDGFKYLNTIDKLTVKVGSGETLATFRLNTIEDVHSLLSEILTLLKS